MRYVIRNSAYLFETGNYWMMSPDIYGAKKFWFKESAESHIKVTPGVHWDLVIEKLTKFETLSVIWSGILHFIDKRM